MTLKPSAATRSKIIDAFKREAHNAMTLKKLEI